MRICQLPILLGFFISRQPQSALGLLALAELRPVSGMGEVLRQ